jgi:hypothetical protein
MLKQIRTGFMNKLVGMFFHGKIILKLGNFTQIKKDARLRPLLITELLQYTDCASVIVLPVAVSIIALNPETSGLHRHYTGKVRTNFINTFGITSPRSR